MLFHFMAPSHTLRINYHKKSQQRKGIEEETGPILKVWDLSLQLDIVSLVNAKITTLRTNTECAWVIM